MKQPDIVYVERFFTLEESRDYFRRLRQEIEWQEWEIKVFGKLRKQPRLAAWYGDPDASYTYSGMTLAPLPWNSGLLEIKGRIETQTQARFNSVLANLYRNGRDSMGSHSDDEPELGKNPILASVSFGAVRTFRFKPKQDPSISKFDIELADGSLLLMKGRTQQDWKHEIPKTSKPAGERINLTFRSIQSRQGRI